MFAAAIPTSAVSPAVGIDITVCRHGIRDKRGLLGGVRAAPWLPATLAASSTNTIPHYNKHQEQLLQEQTSASIESRL